MEHGTWNIRPETQNKCLNEFEDDAGAAEHFLGIRAVGLLGI